MPSDVIAVQEGSGIRLTWQGTATQYQILRDGQQIALVDETTYFDEPTLGGDHFYQVNTVIDGDVIGSGPSQIANIDASAITLEDSSDDLASLIMAIFMLIIGLFLSRHSGWIMKVPDNYMAVSILVLAVFGTYSIGNSYSDVIIMVVLGTIMFFASKAGFSPVPVVLGIILGPIAENNFLLGKLIGGARYGDDWMIYFTTGTINVTLIAICIASITYGLYSNRKSKRST
jgi:hypothetical protein